MGETDEAPKPVETKWEPESVLRYERMGPIIRFRNTIPKSDEMRDLITGIFISFVPEMRQDILNELTHYHKAPETAGAMSLAISGGLKGGTRLD